MGTTDIPLASPEAERLFEERGLTDRERDAARSALAGMTAKAAAEHMGVSSSTVGSLRQRAYHKLGVHGAEELVGRFGTASDDYAEPNAADRDALLAHGLSETQADVLSRVAAGRSSSEVADELGIAPGTVSSARANGYKLLGVHSRDELVAWLGREGEQGDCARPARRRAALVAVGVLVAAFVAAVAGWAVFGSGAPGAQTQDVPEDAEDYVELVGISHTHGVVPLDRIVRGYSGARDVQVTRVGNVDENACVIVEALSDGDPRVLPDGLYRDATIYLTVTSDIEVPWVIDMAPIEASRALFEAGLVADPCFDTFHRRSGNLSPHQPRVESMSVDPGTAVRAGTVIHLEYNGPIDEYANEIGTYLPLYDK